MSAENRKEIWIVSSKEYWEGQRTVAGPLAVTV